RDGAAAAAARGSPAGRARRWAGSYGWPGLPRACGPAMNKVMSGYFDDAHRGLMRQQQQGGGGGTSASSSTVQLPPLRAEGSSQKLAGIGGAAEAEGYPGGGDKISFLQPSHSMGSLDFSQDQISRGVQQERYQQSLQDNSKLSKKIRSLQ
ncbi:unnamed protein product, partial [Prorocentrum cordatum]